MKLLKEEKEFKVFIDGNKKCFRSKKYNYNFNLVNGYFERWGEKVEYDPPFSVFGPEIADIEITTKCSGIGKSKAVCPYCYKDNTHSGDNMSFKDFIKTIQKINVNEQLTSVAFGLGAAADENPDLWNMCVYLRANSIIPNGTIADVSPDTAEKIGKLFGAVAVSYHSDFELLADNVAMLSKYLDKPGYTLKQINIHFVLMEETYDECKKLFEMVRSDKRFEKLNAIVLLGLKKCGRAEKGNFSKISDDHFKDLVDLAFTQKIGIGFDSCSCNKFLSAIKDRRDYAQLEQLAEPCESRLFSIYINTYGKSFPCSFNEKNREGFDIKSSENFLVDYWNNTSDDWRKNLLEAKRSCPVYDV